MWKTGRRDHGWKELNDSTVGTREMAAEGKDQESGKEIMDSSGKMG